GLRFVGRAARRGRDDRESARDACLAKTVAAVVCASRSRGLRAGAACNGGVFAAGRTHARYLRSHGVHAVGGRGDVVRGRPRPDQRPAAIAFAGPAGRLATTWPAASAPGGSGTALATGLARGPSGPAPGSDFRGPFLRRRRDLRTL